MKEMDQKEHQITVVCECHSTNTPYGNTFDVGLTYCITRISKNMCRLKCYGGVIYRKSCWGVLKSNRHFKLGRFSKLIIRKILPRHLRKNCFFDYDAALFGIE